ncbi:MAG TPA: hypothetical protein VN033_13760 [Vulgatibacter sp.]|nr:hypothetical protein [Vulgatibacter sp.]
MGDVVRLPDADRDGRQSLGVSLYLGASSLTFVLLLSLFLVVRTDATPWPPRGASSPPAWLPLLPTLLVGGVALALRAGVQDLLAARLIGLRRRLSVALALGAAYALAGSALWVVLSSRGYRAQSPPGAVFVLLFTWLGVHGILGVGTLAWVRRGVKSGRYHALNSVHVRFVARLWYFVAVHWIAAWILLFVL